MSERLSDQATHPCVVPVGVDSPLDPGVGRGEAMRRIRGRAWLEDAA